MRASASRCSATASISLVMALQRLSSGLCGASTDTSRSTKDAVIAYLLEQSGAKEDMVMVGDTKYDVLGAKAHGIPAIGVSWGYGSVEEMLEAGAVGIAHSMDALLDILHKM